MPTPPSNGLLAELLFLSEKKEKAMSLIKLLDYGMMPDPFRPDQMIPLKSMTSDMFIASLSIAAKSTDLKEMHGAFSAAIIDFGNGPAECVIKVGSATDAAFEYLQICKEKGGRSYCNAFPDVYYLGQHIIKTGAINVAIIEYVDVNTEMQYEAGRLIRFVRMKLDEVMFGRARNSYSRKQLESLLTPDEYHYDYPADLKEILGWSTEDAFRFFETIYGIKADIDLHDGNFGVRKDKSACVFDPVA